MTQGPGIKAASANRASAMADTSNIRSAGGNSPWAKRVAVKVVRRKVSPRTILAFWSARLVSAI
jgi:hypothetical protein